MRIHRAVLISLILLSMAIPSGSMARVAPPGYICFLDAAYLLSDEDRTVDFDDIKVLITVNVGEPEEILSQIDMFTDGDGRVDLSALSKLFKEGHAPVRATDALAILSRDRSWNNVLKFLKNSSEGLGPTITNEVLLDSLTEMAKTTPEKIQAVHSLMRAIGSRG